MRFSQLIAPRTSDVVEIDTPEPGPGEVVVRVSLCGVCASELHEWAGGEALYPLRLGHEPVGIVDQIGPGVERVRVGDRVTGLFQKAYADFCLARETDLLLVPDAVPDEGALGEPLACLINAHRRTHVALGDRVALIGLGFMGLGMLQLLKLSGARRIVAIDVREEAREMATRLGADEVCQPADLSSADRLTRFAEWRSDRGFDVVIEASGTQSGLTLAGELVAVHGILSILGYHQGGTRQVDVGMWNWKAIDVVNSHVRRRNDKFESMRIGLNLAASEMIDLGGLVTHRYGLDEVDRAYADLETKPAGYIKAVI